MRSNFDNEAKEPINKKGNKNHNLDDSDDDQSEEDNDNRNNDSRNDESMSHLAADLRSARNKKIIFFSIGIVIAGLIVLLIVLMLKGGDEDYSKPDITTQIFNPYTLVENKGRSQFSARFYRVEFDSDATKRGNMSIDYYTQNLTNC